MARTSTAYYLSRSQQGTSKLSYVKKEDLPRVRVMTARHKTLKRLIGQMSDLNWQILLLQSGREEQP